MSKCYICDKDENELKSFGGPGDPLVGDFTGQKLVKVYRALYEGPEIDEYEQILDEYTSEAQPGDIWKDNINELEAKYGHEKVDKAFNYDQAKSTVGSSWECRDCIIK
jgi:hypothetical protein